MFEHSNLLFGMNSLSMNNTPKVRYKRKRCRLQYIVIALGGEIIQ
jgi:hypothetical protein